MKALVAILLIAGVIQSSTAPARAPTPSPLLGSWVVDVSRLPTPLEARPKSVTITFSDAAGGKWTMRVDIVDAGGTESHAVGTATLDGRATSVEGSMEADTAAFKMPEPNVLVLALGKGGVPASTRIYAVDADGKAMIETAVYFGNDGLPVMRTNYFTRMH
jgi:hypothetical protein